MRLYEEQISVPLPAQSAPLLSHIAAHLGENLPADAMPLRFVATRTGKDSIDCEVGVLTGLGHEHPARSRSILDFRPRTHESCECFTTVLVVPTGIDAKIGGSLEGQRGSNLGRHVVGEDGHALRSKV